MDPISVSTEIAAPREKAWSAYVTPADITCWNFASDDWCCPSADIEPREGGRWLARMEAKDGSMGFDFAGKLEEFARPAALTIAMEDGRRARTLFEETGAASCRVTTTFDADPDASEAMQRGGWQAILDNFRRHVETKA